MGGEKDATREVAAAAGEATAAAHEIHTVRAPNLSSHTFYLINLSNR